MNRSHSSAGEGSPGGRQWLTLPGQKRVLAIVHSLTYLKRMRDVLALFEGDFRVQVLFTAPPHVFGGEVPHALRELGSAVVPWEQATRERFDLALAAGPRGVSEVDAPLVALSHGAGYVKRISGLGPEEDGIPGLRRKDVMPDGATLPAALTVPHTEELRGLARSCPEALPITRVVGDPVCDRVTASLPHRAAYREALGLRAEEKLVLFLSTWGPHSAFAKAETLLPRLATELPKDRFRTAVLLHPNVFAWHGRYQVSAWLAACVRRGIAIFPPETEWRSLLIAADHLLGDHGSLSVYATLTDAPILLASSPEGEINPDSPAATLAATAPALTGSTPLPEQLAYAASQYRREEYAAIAARLTSCPGEFARRMRRVLYLALGLGQPAHEPPTARLPLPVRPPEWSGPGAPGAAWEVSA
ncbi:hypothetical protein ABZ929_21555 [Streptomyces physcomitrii]|uniref:hypothetical protein n=1 Tax=Streptomyces physcomitrii TaxID=2724184 RepID=UPI00344849B9